MNRHRGIGAVVAVLLLTLVAACGSDGTTGADASSTAEEESVVADPTTEAEEVSTPEGATVQQWASIIAEQQLSFDETWENFDEKDCGVMLMGPDVNCEAIGLTLYYNAQTISTVIEGARKPSAPAFIGDPPAEIADLVDETQDAADAAVAAWETRDEADCDGGGCVSQAFEFDSALDDIRAQLAAWGPYL